ncbi:hypothetical protein [Belnapia rosea]|uniref:hypothetical protein n=1 Tax=Belnapia rosea TaxID=938405 RepID=UPI000887D211|nr:hypothetical protein [Belnapia rosea]SDB71386.1 hypothetical protein SAMN02927895_04062 [Belnapia rosea]
MLKRTGLFLATATLLAACATAPAGMQRAAPPAHATGAGIGGPVPATGAAPAAAPAAASAPEHRHH